MNGANTEVSECYRNLGGVPFAARISLHVRCKMFRIFMRRFQPGSGAKILDVGVTCDTGHVDSNYFERFYPYPASLTCVGTEDGSHLMPEYPGVRYQRIRAGEPLPFRDGEFDIVFSNAVLEHTGVRASQAAFVQEICRVGKAFFITTPSRLFPVEHHTGLPFVHYLPPALFRKLIGGTRYAYWANPANLNILTSREFAGLFPAGVTPEMRVVRLAGLPANLIAMGNSGTL